MGFRKNAEGLTVRQQSPKPTHSAIGRFLKKLLLGSQRLGLDGSPLSPCWDWQGCTGPNGYGQFKVDGRRDSTVRQGPHRFAYEYFTGPVPDGFEIHHICYNRRCVNPLHLEAVTHKANLLDNAAKTFAARNASKTHCSHGHELAGENLYQYQGRRSCRACNARRQREIQARRKGNR